MLLKSNIYETFNTTLATWINIFLPCILKMGLSKGYRKSYKKKIVDPFYCKYWYNDKVPNMFVTSEMGKTWWILRRVKK